MTKPLVITEDMEALGNPSHHVDRAFGELEVSVKATGAVGDGVADDTAAIQRAIDVGGPYASIVFPPGTYLFSQLVLPNPLALIGQATVRSRWNTYGANVTLLADGSADPAILIGGTAESVVTETGFEFAEGIRLANLLLRPKAGTGRGILVDGSTTIRATRGAARDIHFENVHITGFTDHNLEMLGDVFDVRFTGCSSRDCAVTGIIGTTAASHTGGDSTPGQVHFVNCYLYGNPTGPQFALDCQANVYGGGIAYGNGFCMRSYSGLYGTHVEGDAEEDTVGVQIMGTNCQVRPSIVTNYETGIRIGDGDAHDYTGHVISTVLSTLTNGIHVTDAGRRVGMADVYFFTVTNQVVDERLSVDGIPASLDVRLAYQYQWPPTTGVWVPGCRTKNQAGPGAGYPEGWQCIVAGAPGTWAPLPTLPGAVAKTTDYTATANDSGKRFANTGAGFATTITLPVSAVGMRFSFTRNAAWSFNIDPNGTEIIHPDAAGHFLSLGAIGSSVTLECLVAGAWCVVAQTGTITYE